MKKTILSLVITASALTLSPLVQAQEKTPPAMKPEATEFYTPVPPKVTPGANNTAPPSDAIVLFDGTSLNGFVSARDGSPAAWTIENGELVVSRGKGDIQSKLPFGDAQYHVEWSAPTEIVGEGQGRGNSGFFLMGIYEVQVQMGKLEVSTSNLLL